MTNTRKPIKYLSILLISFYMMLALPTGIYAAAEYDIGGIKYSKDNSSADQVIKSQINAGKSMDDALEYYNHFAPVFRAIEKGQVDVDTFELDKDNNPNTPSERVKTSELKAFISKSVTNYKNGNVSSPGVTGKLISSPGVFTSGFYEPNMATCETQMAVAKYTKTTTGAEVAKGDGYNAKLEDDNAESDTSKSKGNKMITDVAVGVSESAISEESASGDSERGLAALNCGELNVFANLLKVYDPVNITSSSIIMNIVFAFQIAAIGVAVLLIAVFGVYVASGNMVFDPMKFLIRGFCVLLVVYFFPYFAQDILNVNNMLVYFFGLEKEGFGATTYMVAGSIGFVGMVSFILSAAGTLLVFNVGAIGLLLIGALIFLYLIVTLVKVVVTLTFWWYARFLMIVLLVALGPVFIVMMLLPKTAEYGGKWLRFFVGEVFSQTMMVIGFYFATKLMQDLPTLNREMGLSLIGDVFLMYATFLLLQRLPQLSAQIFGSGLGVVGWNDALKAGSAVGDFVKNAGVALTGMAARGVQGSQMDKLNAKQAQLAKMREEDPTGFMNNENYKKLNDDVNNRVAKISDRLKNTDNASKALGDFRTGKVGMLSGKELMTRQNKSVEPNKEKLKEVSKQHEDDMEKADKDYVYRELQNKQQEEKESFNDKLGKINAGINKAEKTMNEAKANNNPEKAAQQQEEIDRLNKQKDSLIAKHDQNMDYLNFKMSDKKVEEEANKRRMAADNKLTDSLGKVISSDAYKNTLEHRNAVANMADNIKSKTQEELGKKKDALNNASEPIQNAAKKLAETRMEATESLANNLIRQGVATPDNAMAKANTLMNAQMKKHELATEMQSRKANGQEVTGAITSGIKAVEEVLAKEGPAATSISESHASGVKSAMNELASARNNYAKMADIQHVPKEKISENLDAKLQTGTMEAVMESNSMKASIISSFNSSNSVDVSGIKSSMENSLTMSGLAPDVASKVATTKAAEIGSAIQSVRSLSSSAVNGAISVTEFSSGITEQLSPVVGAETASQMASAQIANIRSAAFTKDTSYEKLSNATFGANTVSVPSMEAYESGDKLINAAPTGSVERTRAFEILPDRARTEIAGAYATVLSQDVSVDSLRSQMPEVIKNLEANYGSDVVSKAVSEISSNIKQASVISHFDSISEALKTGNYGGITVDTQNNTCSGHPNNVIKAATDALVTQGLSNSDAEYVAKSYVSQRDSGNNISLTPVSLTDDLKNMVISAAVEHTDGNNINRNDFDRQLDRMFGKNTNVRKLTNDFVDELETKLKQ